MTIVNTRPDDSILPAWVPADYFLRNKFCPTDAIQHTIDEERERCGVEWMLLLTLSKNSLLRSLGFIAARDPNLVNSFTSRINIAHLYSSETQGIIHNAGVPPELLVRAGFLSKSDSDFHQRRLPADRHAPDALAAVIVSNSARIDEISDSWLEDIELMLNATAVANSRRDQIVSSRIRNAREANDSETPTIAPLLEIATDLVEDSTAVYYAFDPVSGTINSHPANSARGSLRLPAEISVLDTSRPVLQNRIQAIRRAYNESRTLIYPDPAARSLRRGNVGPKTSLTVALPVPSAPFGKRNPNLGVLVVSRSAKGGSGSLRAFTLYELTLLRNVALRIALQLTRQAADEFGAEVSRVTNLATAPSDGIPKNPRIFQGAEVPADLFLCFDALSDLAATIHNLTHSNTVTIRTLVPVERGNRHAYALRRFVAFPPEHVDDDHPDITLTPWNKKHSATAFVASTNRVAYVYDTSLPIGPQVPGLVDVLRVESREPIRSELSVPIVSDGLIVGTLNLESASVHNFDAGIGVAKAFASLAGLTISMQRRATLRDLSQRLSRIRIGYHESIHASALLMDLRRTALTEKQEEYIDGLERLIFDSRTRASKITVPSNNTLSARELTEASVSKFGFSGSVAIAIPQAVMMNDLTGAVYSEVLSEVMLNAQKYATVDAPPQYLIEYSPTVLAGRRYHLISTSSVPSGTQKSGLISRLYRIPIEDPSRPARPHLGSFSVAEMVRAIGGDIHAYWTSRGKLETRILIPEFVEVEQ